MGSIATGTTAIPTKSGDIDWKAIQLAILEIDLVSKGPMELFKAWFAEAKTLQENTYPEAMTLATVRNDGGPSARTVLLRGLDDHGFKCLGSSVKKNCGNCDSRGALVLTYKDCQGTVGGRQVRIEGILERLTEEDSSDYFNGEPLVAQFRATACHQSRVVTDGRESTIKEIISLWENVEGDRFDRLDGDRFAERFESGFAIETSTIDSISSRGDLRLR